jgi:hypothetical protein
MRKGPALQPIWLQPLEVQSTAVATVNCAYGCTGAEKHRSLLVIGFQTVKLDVYRKLDQYAGWKRRMCPWRQSRVQQ